MKKVKIEICTGTTCYVMGAGDLANMEEVFDSRLSEAAELKGSPCFGLCKDVEYRGAPYVRVNDVLVQQATVEKVLREVKRQLEG